MYIRKNERRAITLLLAITLVLFVVPQVTRSREQPFFMLVEGEAIDTLLPRPKAPPAIELNSVDSVGLVRVRGIGPYYARKILRYRERLGGFYSPRQLKDLKYQYLNIDSLLPLFTADANLIVKQDLDTMSFKSVLRHPYLEYEDVQLIFNAKRELGTISYDSLQRHGVLPPQKLKRIKAYFH